MTRTRESDTCGRCLEFSLRHDQAEPEKGLGWCRAREELHPYDDRGCPLWERAKDLASRELWIAKMILKQQATGS